MNHSNLEKHLTLSALIVASAILFEKVFAEEISSGEELATIITTPSSDVRTGTLTKDITAIADLGILAGTQLTIDGTNTFGISGNEKTGISLSDGQTLIINNVGSLDLNNNITSSWNGFKNRYTDPSINSDNPYLVNKSLGGAIANIKEGGTTGKIKINNSIFFNNHVTNSDDTANADGGVIANMGNTTIDNTIFSKNYANISASNSIKNADATGGAIYNYLQGTMTITNSTFFENSAKTLFSDDTILEVAKVYGGAIMNGRGTMTITGSNFSGNYATATAKSASAYGGAIMNSKGTVTIIDSSFSNNYASATATASTAATTYAKGGAIYNDATGTLNIIAKENNSVFSGNYREVNGTKTKNDIYGSVNLYAAKGKMISFDGGIVSEGNSPSVNINVKSSTTYDVNGTVLFKANSINSYNKFILGAGTLKLENGITWTSNTLALNGGTLDIGSSTGNDIGTLNYDGGSLTLKNGANINIDISGTENDKIVFFNNAQLILEGGHQITVDLTYDAAIGDNFIIMSGFNWTGMLDENCVMLSSNPEDWNIDKHLVASITQINGTNSLLLTVAAIPEPSMFGLFAGLATLALVGTRRRRK